MMEKKKKTLRRFLEQTQKRAHGRRLEKGVGHQRWALTKNREEKRTLSPPEEDTLYSKKGRERPVLRKKALTPQRERKGGVHLIQVRWQVS